MSDSVMPRRILIIQHLDIEGPGTLAPLLAGESIQFDVVRPDRGERVPETLAGRQALVVLGGPMNVYEEERYPFLRGEKALLKKAVADAVPVLGICLGAQLLACACGAAVQASVQPEIGWFQVQLSEAGRADALFRGLPANLEVFQWHGDMFGIPTGGSLLALAAACPHQAFRFGLNAYGLQFHLEVDAAMIESWIRRYLPAERQEEAVRRMLSEAAQKERSLAGHARQLFGNFARMLAA